MLFYSCFNGSYEEMIKLYFCYCSLQIIFALIVGKIQLYVSLCLCLSKLCHDYTHLFNVFKEYIYKKYFTFVLFK